jgi:hypothetical protein
MFGFETFEFENATDDSTNPLLGPSTTISHCLWMGLDLEEGCLLQHCQSIHINLDFVQVALKRVASHHNSNHGPRSRQYYVCP